MAKLFDNRFKEVRTYRLKGETHRRSAGFFSVLPQKVFGPSYKCAKPSHTDALLWCAHGKSRFWPNHCLTARCDALL
jgi:hypothetical protein